MGEAEKQHEQGMTPPPRDDAGSAGVTQFPRPAGAAGVAGSAAFLGCTMLVASLCGPMAPRTSRWPLAIWFACSLPAMAASCMVGWKLYRPTARHNENRWRIWTRLLTSLCLALGAVGLMLGLMGGMHAVSSSVYRANCAANMRQIGQAIMLYANDHGGQFPATLEQLITANEVNPEIFICPNSNDDRATGPTTQAVLSEFAKPGHCSYIYIGAGLNRTTPKLADIVMAYEKPENEDGEGMNVLFGDGHVEWVRGAAATKMMQELKAGQNPPPSLGMGSGE